MILGMKNQKGFIAIAAIIIGLLVIGGGAYYYVNNQENSSYNEVDLSNTTGKEKIEENQINISETSNDINNWKTYVNEIYGLRFKYPKNYTVSSNVYATNPEEAGELFIRKIKNTNQ